MATHPSQCGFEEQIVDVDVLLSGYDGGLESGLDRDDSDNQSSGPPPLTSDDGEGAGAQADELDSSSTESSDSYASLSTVLDRIRAVTASKEPLQVAASVTWTHKSFKRHQNDCKSMSKSSDERFQEAAEIAIGLVGDFEDEKSKLGIGKDDNLNTYFSKYSAWLKQHVGKAVANYFEGNAGASASSPPASSSSAPSSAHPSSGSTTGSGRKGRKGKKAERKTKK